MTTKKIAIIARHSTDKQSADYQIQCLRKVAEERGDDVVAIYRVQVSGKYGIKDRNDLKEILELSKMGKISTVYCTELSRIGRNFSLIHTFIDELIENKTSLYIHSYKIETLNEDKSINVLTTALLGALSTASVMERQWTITRIKLALENCRKNGIRLGRPLGSKKSEDNFIQQYNEIFILLLKGLTIRQVQKLSNFSTTTICKANKILKQNPDRFKIAA